jgi:hypothetical protein
MCNEERRQNELKSLTEKHGLLSKQIHRLRIAETIETDELHKIKQGEQLKRQEKERKRVEKQIRQLKRRCLPLIFIILLVVLLVAVLVVLLYFTLTPSPVSTAMPTITPIPTTMSWSLGSAHTYNDPNDTCKIQAIATSDNDRGNVFKITAAIDADGGYCGFVLPLHGYDASTQTRLTFWMRGENGSGQILVGLKDTEQRQQKLEQGVPDQWQKVSILLSQFQDQRSDLDLSSLEDVSVNFDGLGDSTIYVDDFLFEGP